MYLRTCVYICPQTRQAQTLVYLFPICLVVGLEVLVIATYSLAQYMDKHTGECWRTSLSGIDKLGENNDSCVVWGA